MIPAILVPVLKALAAKGFSTLVGAVQAKGTQVIEEKLGIKLPEKIEELTPEFLYKLKERTMEYEEFLIDAQIRKAEVGLKLDALNVENTEGARKMNADIQISEHASYISKVAPYWLDFLIVGSTLLISALLFFIGVPVENEKLMYMVLGSLVTMCGTILNFHRGTSSSSKSKDEVIKLLSKE